jgi:chorismate mutase / prephenate dehydrogenase
MSDPSLVHLRLEIARTDERILQDVTRRLRLAQEVGRLKRDEGLPLRDYLLEREVVQRWVEGLAPSAVPPDRAESLVRWMIEEAVYAQEVVPEPARVGPPSSEVVVVGGLGQMGGWMRDYLRAAGHRVGVVDRRTPAGPVPFPVSTDLARAAKDADLVVVATPMRVAPGIYKQLLATETEATIFDILSVKAPLLPWIRRGIAQGRHISSAHPLFGPGARSLFGRNLLVLDCGDEKATSTVASLFRKTALKVTHLPIEDHDPLVADVLGLPHVLSLLFARTLTHGRRSPHELATGASTSFRRIAEVAQIVTRENPELVGDIQTLNPASKGLFRRLEVALKDLERAVDSGESGQYATLLEEGRSFLELSSWAALPPP